MAIAKKKKLKRLKRIYGQRFCYYCGHVLQVGHTNRDHVIPKAGGGKTLVGNTVLACVDCNTLKGATPIMEWTRIMVLTRVMACATTLTRRTYNERQTA